MADLGHLPPTWFRSPGRGQAWHFGPARPNRGRIAPCGIGLPSGYKVAREPIGGRDPGCGDSAVTP